MNNHSINWKDPLYLKDSLSEQEINILNTVKKYCNTNLFPRVTKDNKNKKYITVSYSRHPN